MSELPVVDMQDPSAPAALVKAFKEFGFIYLENHGFPEDVIKRVYQASKAFFALDEDDKLAVRADKNSRGFTAMHEETLDAAYQTKGGTKEMYDVYREIAADSEDATKPLRGPNQWPSEDLVPGWKETMQDYFNRMHAMVVKVCEVLSDGLGVDPAFFVGCISESMSVLRQIHYSSEFSDLDKGVIACGAHTDYGLLTILTTDDAGLQVMHDGEWLEVHPRPGAFILNVGDMLERWTNGHLKATTHRVVNKLGRERHSLAFFCQPNYDAVVECLPQFCSEDNPAKYQTATSGMLLSGLYKKRIDDFDSNRVK